MLLYRSFHGSFLFVLIASITDKILLQCFWVPFFPPLFPPSVLPDFPVALGIIYPRLFGAETAPSSRKVLPWFSSGLNGISLTALYFHSLIWFASLWLRENFLSVFCGCFLRFKCSEGAPWKCWFGLQQQKFSITLGMGGCCSPLPWVWFSLGVSRKTNEGGGFSLYNFNFALQAAQSFLGIWHPCRIQQAEGLLWARSSGTHLNSCSFLPLEVQINKSPGSAAGPNI